MEKVKYWFIMMWHFYIIGDAWWITLEYSAYRGLGTILTTTYGQDLQIIWKNEQENRILVIEWE